MQHSKAFHQNLPAWWIPVSFKLHTHSLWARLSDKQNNRRHYKTVLLVTSKLNLMSEICVVSLSIIIVPWMNLPQSFMHFITAHYSATQCNRKLPDEMQQHSKITKTKQHNETQRYATQTFKATLYSYHKVNKSLMKDVAWAFQLFTLVRCISHHFPRSSARKIHFRACETVKLPEEMEQLWYLCFGRCETFWFWNLW